MDRRSFLKGSVIGAAAIAATRLMDKPLLAAEPAQKAVLRLCSQDGVVAGKSLKEKVEKLQKWGCWAVELGGNPNVKDAQDAIKGTDLKISALCWGSHSGDLVCPDKAKQQKGIDDLKKALEKAGELECTDGVIFVPCFNGQSKLKAEELDKVLDEILPAIGDYAQKCKTRILLEPLTKGETFYINRVEQAAAICDRINNPGICLMGDFYHMAKEETDQTQAFVRGAKWLHHVHLATRDHRIAPGQEPHSFIEGMKGLKMIGYQNTCSLECGVRGNRDEELPKVFDYLRKQWELATV
jgi:sugar phosphate isomerase/epimerase